IETFDEKYQETILNKMQEWYDNGELEKLINESLDTKYHQMVEKFTTQLAQTEHLIADIMQSNIYNFGAKNNFSEGNQNFDNTNAIQNAVDFALSKEGNGIVYIPNG